MTEGPKRIKSSPIIYIGLYAPPFPKEMCIGFDSSWLFNHALRFSYKELFGFGIPGIKKDSSLGIIFEDLEPKEDGSFTIELGVVLPDYLPSHNENHAHIINIPFQGEQRILCVSNTMAKISYCQRREKSSFQISDILDESEFMSSLKTRKSQPLKRIWEFLDPELQEIIGKWVGGQSPSQDIRDLLIKNINKVIEMRNFYDEYYFKNLSICKEGINLLKIGLGNLDGANIRKFNRIIFESIYLRLIKRSYGYFYWLVDKRAIYETLNNIKLRIPQTASVEFLKTMVTSRFIIKGTTAEDALTSELEKCINEFSSLINILLDAYIMAKGSDPHPSVFSIRYDKSNFDCFYVLMQGEKKDIIKQMRIAPHLGRSALNPTILSKEELNRFHKTIGDECNIAKELLYSSKQLIMNGHFAFALLQIIIACEIVITKYVVSKYQSAGVSNNKIKDSEKDLGLSMKLNLELPTLAPDSMKPSGNMINMINKGRKIRNKIVHEGKIEEVSEESVGEVFNAAIELFEYLEKVEKFETNQ
ncbi:MAG: hypothetical protein K8T10_20150 [Candidatus Eremiobacteraeota bacterium]|nr:hypothetical protein [Candidatus Eremiobacteraeota bacterium]